ncbi:MAG: signal peptidase II [Candidatus Cloacimonadaceae bacterium]|jgi:signal peptidase II|nr:signal peptidase II [Candidatus Cloacimonadota bacterium]MDY0127108.1 signal peptidase II [Candidatus Cloacimonadaceae bacterium]MCB5255338.1 signal peptidase II [Candidatus Cloacimonadota bacterium]MCK9178981.1 signal peptidase II [Candidatus Cloacimonadota bacterium]MCK9242797.1 signal peptidase II [Candidatus Cloacimonadota bacterium]
MKTKLKIAPAYLIMMIVLVVDQITKLLVRTNIELYHSVPVLANLFGDTFLLTHVNNTGAAFSLGFSSDVVNRVFFIATTCIAMIFIVYLLYQSTHRIQVVAFGLVMGGALGNLIDRILLGGVTDFINVDFPDFIMHRFPIFNVADSCIFIAVCLLIIDLFFIKDAPAAKSEIPAREQIPQDMYSKEI